MRQLSDSPQKRLCQLRVFVMLSAMATPLICGVALPSGLTLTRKKNKHTHSHKKPDLDYLHHLCLGMSLSLPSLSLTDTSLPLQWHSGHLNWPGSPCIHSLIGPSPAVTRELVVRIFKLKPLYMLRHKPICHIAQYF